MILQDEFLGSCTNGDFARVLLWPTNNAAIDMVIWKRKIARSMLVSSSFLIDTLIENGLLRKQSHRPPILVLLLWLGRSQPLLLSLRIMADHIHIMISKIISVTPTRLLLFELRWRRGHHFISADNRLHLLSYANEEDLSVLG